MSDSQKGNDPRCQAFCSSEDETRLKRVNLNVAEDKQNNTPARLRKPTPRTTIRRTDSSLDKKNAHDAETYTKAAELNDVDGDSKQHSNHTCHFVCS